MESKWSQDPETERPELVLDAMEAMPHKSAPRRGWGTFRDAPGRSETLREPGLGALIKENIRESDSGSDVRDRTRHSKKALGA